MKYAVTILTILMLSFAVFSVGNANAQDQTITITVTIQNLSINLGGGSSLALGVIGLGDTPTTWTDTTPVDGGQYTVTNNGNVNQDITISVANSADWTAGAAGGDSTFALGFGVTSTVGVEPAYTNITSGGVPLTAGLAPTTSFSFDLEFQAPTVTSSYTEQSIVVTISGSAS